jgi:hypothetical protein
MPETVNWAFLKDKNPCGLIIIGERAITIDMLKSDPLALYTNE